MPSFKEIRNTLEVLKNVDIAKVISLSRKVDMGELMEMVSSLSEKDLARIMKYVKRGGGNKKREAPPINADFYELNKTLTPAQRELQLQVRHFMETEVRPIANEYWERAEFPHHLIPKAADLCVAGMMYEGYGCRNESSVMDGVIAMEMARVDASFSTFMGVHSGLAMGSIYTCGSKEQKDYWLPKMRNLEIIGAFGLTEPEVGSAAAGGLNTTCRKEGDHWILNGEKKWIGNATFSDITIIWARNEADDKVKGFIVEKDTPGYSADKMTGKMALRTTQNAQITLNNCRIPESHRLQNANSFRDTAKVLKLTRAGVAWQSVGCARGAYEAALAYTLERQQFGRPIASYQLMQNHLVHMLADLTATQSMVFRLSQMQDDDTMKDEHASLAKVFCTTKMRDIVSRAREVMGGNGILLHYDVARFVADAEALYSYEGTKEINTLIVGRAITGHSAFV